MSTVGKTDLTAGRASASAQTAEELTSEDFKQLFRHHPAGVAVITLAGEHGPVGFTATSVISVSAAPPLLAFAIASTSSSWQALRRADTVLVNFLDVPAAHLSQQFARRGVDRFDGVAYHRLPTGEPVLEQAAAWLRARVVDRFPTGESHLVTLRAVASRIARDQTPLVYHDRTYHGIGPQSRL